MVLTFKRYVDEETGERLLGRIDTKEDIERRIKNDSKQRQYLQDKRKYEKALERGNALDFTVVYMENVKNLIEELEESKQIKRTYLGYLLVLQSYVDYNGILRMNNQSHVPFNRTDIKKVLKIASWDTTREFIDLLLDNGVLKEVDTPHGKGFELNKKYSFKGKASDKAFVRSFNKNIRKVYEENSASDVSFLFSLLPYINAVDNTLSHNPYEQEAMYVDVLSTKEIATIAGVSVDTVYRIRSRMTFKNMSVFMVEKNNGLNKYKVNPLVLFRQANEPNELLVRPFIIKGKE